MSDENIIKISDDEFDKEVLQSDKPILVDFWAEWCGPCRAIAPTLEALADEYAGQIRVGKVNVDDNPKAASKFGVRAIPTMIIFKDGEVAEQITGAVGKAKIEDAIKNVIA